MGMATNAKIIFINEPAEKIKVFSDVLDKITQFAVNTLDGLTKQVAYLQGLLQNMQQRIVKLEQRPIAVAPAAPAAAAPGAPIPTPAAAAPAPKPPPKPMSPMSARAALQGELKALFAKRKQQG